MLRTIARTTIYVGALLAVSCAHMTPSMPEPVAWSKPAEGDVTRISIGDTMLSVGNAVQMQVISVPHGVEVAGFHIPAGDYRVAGTFKEGTVFRAILRPGQVQPTSAQKVVNALMGPPKPSSTQRLTWKQNAEGTPHLCLAGCVPAPSAKVEWVDHDSFERRLEFSGFEGRVLHVDYREFSSQAARPAFTSRLRFDLSRSRVVDVKGARIEILRVSNQALEYRVIEPFRSSDPVAERNGRRAVNVPAAPR